MFKSVIHGYKDLMQGRWMQAECKVDFVDLLRRASHQPA
jgi:hypothetical protein